MKNSSTNLKLIQNSRKEDGEENTPTPLMRRANKLTDLQSAKNLVSKANSKYLRGELHETTFKSILYAAQVFSQIYKDFLFEKGIVDYLSVRFALQNFDTSKALDSLLEVLIEKFKLDRNKLVDIEKNFRNKYLLSKEERQKRTRKILNDLEDEKQIKIKLINEKDVTELKRLILLAIRKLPENEKYDLIENEIRNEFYQNEE